jgi:flagellar hook-associated protein 2
MAGIQLSGLASGLDTEGMITQLMALERQPETRWSQQKTISQTKEQALKDVLSRIKTLQTNANDLKSVTTWLPTQSVDVTDSTKLTASAVSGAAPGSYSMSVSQLATSDQWSFKYTAPAADTSFTVTTSAGTQQVALKAGTSLDDAVGIINTATDSKVYAINVGGRMVLSSRETGGTNSFTVSPVSGADALDDALHMRTAQDAKYSLDGGTTTLTSSSNTVTNAVPGVSVTLKALIPTSTPVSVNVGNPAVNSDSIKTKVQTFVDQYNSTIDFIQSKLTEAPVKDPKTTSDLVKGTLFNDQGLNSILQSLRGSIGSIFNTGSASVDQLSEIGITTGATTGSGTISQDALAGKLSFDPTKLVTALSTNPVAVRKLLGGVSGTDGIAQRFGQILDPLTKTGGDFDSRIKSAESEQKDFQDRIDQMETRVSAHETLLRAQFAAMESAISSSKSTSSWLTQQLG